MPAKKNTADHQILTALMTEILSYYEAQILREISKVIKYLLLTLLIVLASTERAFDLSHAQGIEQSRQKFFNWT